MSLITRCPACATLFKVVPDQLRISSGWVRCGHCNHVFDAAAHMVDAPPPLVAPAAPEPLPEPTLGPEFTATAAPGALAFGERAPARPAPWPAPPPPAARAPIPVQPPVPEWPEPQTDYPRMAPAPMPTAPAIKPDALATPPHSPPSPGLVERAGGAGPAQVQPVAEPVSWQTLWRPHARDSADLSAPVAASDEPRRGAALPPAVDAPDEAPEVQPSASGDPVGAGEASAPGPSSSPWVVSAPVPIAAVSSVTAAAVPWTDAELKAWSERRRAERDGASAPVPAEVAAPATPAPDSGRAVLQSPEPMDAPGTVPGRPTSWSELAPLAGEAVAPAKAVEEGDRTEPAPAALAGRRPGTGVDFLLSGVGEPAGGPNDSESDSAAAVLDPTLPADDLAPSPSFVRAARRRAFWASRPVRFGLFAGLLLLTLALALQLVLAQRDRLAAREPGWAPMLQALCEPLGCTLQPYRQLDAVVIDSSAFNRVDATSFRFSVSLRNERDLRIATPSLELTLTDVQDQPLVRRVLSPAQLGAPATLGPKDDFNTTQLLTLSAAARPAAVANYRLVAFYP